MCISECVYQYICIKLNAVLYLSCPLQLTCFESCILYFIPFQKLPRSKVEWIGLWDDLGFLGNQHQMTSVRVEIPSVILYNQCSINESTYWFINHLIIINLFVVVVSCFSTTILTFMPKTKVSDIPKGLFSILLVLWVQISKN